MEDGIPVIIDNDSLVGYEKNSWVEILRLPVIWALVFLGCLEEDNFRP